MNLAALQHAASGAGAYALDAHHLRVVLRAAAGDLDSGTVVWRDRYAPPAKPGQRLPLARVASDGITDYWAATLAAETRRVWYAFCLRSGREVVWLPARYHAVLSVLKNPVYAGAYAYGRSKTTVRLDAGQKQVRRQVRRHRHSRVGGRWRCAFARSEIRLLRRIPLRQRRPSEAGLRRGDGVRGKRRGRRRGAASPSTRSSRTASGTAIPRTIRAGGGCGGATGQSAPRSTPAATWKGSDRA